MFKIGDFSKVVRVSPRMLRHYEKCGLLYPAEIDKFTGYRQYSARQIPLVVKIVTLRDLGFSINEISDILPHYDDVAYMDNALRAKANLLKANIEAEQGKYNRLIEMQNTMKKEKTIMIEEVVLKKLPPVNVLSLRGIIPHYRDEGMLWEKLGKYVAENNIKCDGGGYSVFYDKEYKEENPDVEIAIPVVAPGKNSGEFIYKTYDEIPLAACVRFTGPFDGGYDAADEKLAVWMEENGYTFAGLSRGHVITGPDEELNPENWVAELQTPVQKVQE